jgi:hypothetical protein
MFVGLTPETESPVTGLLRQRSVRAYDSVVAAED